jgi:hypothetical protein
MIARLEVVQYPRGRGDYWTETFDSPDWYSIDAVIRSMEPYEKPIVSLLKNRDIPDADLMMVNGGDEVFHIQIANSDMRWSEVFDPDGSEEIVDVWTSDQGFSTSRKSTWSLEDALAIIRYYFDKGKPHPEYHWR